MGGTVSTIAARGMVITVHRTSGPNDVAEPATDAP